jgi:nicotinamide-nucleotide amidase
MSGLRVQLLLTGNELMSGVTVDSNSARIAQMLEALNIRVSGKITIGDDMARLCTELDRLAAQSDVLIVNGGLGPTTDDLTAQALATVCAVPLEWNPESLAHIEQWCHARGIESNDANRKQAFLPAGCAIIPNEIGSAVGFRMQHRGCEILCTPGVPSELFVMMEREIVPWLRARFPSEDEVVITRLQCFGIGESAAQQLITESCPDWPAHIELGFRAGAPNLEVKVSSFRSEHAADRIVCEKRVKALLGDYIYGCGDTTLQRTLVDLLAARGQRMATAESCTGGLIAAMITEVPGASAVFEAGYVTYANRIKTSVCVRKRCVRTAPSASRWSWRWCAAASNAAARITPSR